MHNDREVSETGKRTGNCAKARDGGAMAGPTELSHDFAIILGILLAVTRN
jgi:hypothetical protein